MIEHLTRDEIAIIAAIIDAENCNFVELVRISQLDPRSAFRGSDLQGIDFGAVNISAFDFTRADLRGANLSEVIGLSVGRIAGVIFDNETKWPYYFDRVIKRGTKAKRKIFRYPYGKERKKWTEWSYDIYWEYHNGGDDQKTLEYCRHIQKIDPTSSPAFYFAAHMLDVHLQSSSEAIFILEDRIAVEPEEINNYFFYAQTLENSRRYSEAETYYRKTLDLAGNESINRARATCSLVNCLLKNPDLNVVRLKEMRTLLSKVSGMNDLTEEVIVKIKSLKNALKDRIHEMRKDRELLMFN